jgi:hypothetical protein
MNLSRMCWLGMRLENPTFQISISSSVRSLETKYFVLRFSRGLFFTNVYIIRSIVLFV